ncbi:MAG: DNA replication/repair protein RecF [Gammaproteobacteria bacterium]
MFIESLQIDRVRNLEKTEIKIKKKLNIFTGNNASGKTAILESIYILSRAKSFRTPRIQNVIKHQNKSLLITAKVQHEHDGVFNTGIEKKHGNVVIKRNGEKIKAVSDQAKKIPIVLITQDTHNLISGGPKQRRHWLDWAMFHVEPDYLDHWKRFMKALRQRNILLKKKEKNREFYRGWEEAMVEFASLLTKQRSEFLHGITKHFKEKKHQFCSEDIKISLNQGWGKKQQYKDLLDETWQKDFERGYTQLGIHQADVNFILEERKIHNVFSRGQIKMFTVFLLFSQAKEIEKRTGIKPVILIDDFKAELDGEGSKRILTWLAKEGYQAFLSTTELGEDEQEIAQSQMFHVEYGKISIISKG